MGKLGWNADLNKSVKNPPAGETRNGEKLKGIIAGAVIVFSVLLLIVRLRAASGPPAKAPVPSPPQGGVEHPASGPAPGAPPGQGLTQSGRTSSPLAPSAASAGVRIPDTKSDAPIRDPFVLTPKYHRILAKSGSLDASDQSGPTQRSPNPSPPGGISSPLPSIMPGVLALPPAQVGPKAARPLPHMGTKEAAAARTQTAPPTAPPAATSPSKEDSASPSKVGDENKESGPDYVLTGTVEGEVPQAIIRGKDRSYLLGVKEWLGGEFQVQRISPGLVELRDRSGRLWILKLKSAHPLPE